MGLHPTALVALALARIRSSDMNHKFNLTRDRSVAGKKYEFDFIDNARKAIVPIFQRYQSGEYRIIGTGSYFIEPHIFITAAHIFEGKDINHDDGFYIAIEGVDEPVPLVEKHVHEYLDLAILVLDESGITPLQDVNPLAVMNLPPEIGEVVAIFEYSHSIVEPENTHLDKNGNTLQEIKLRSKWEVGGVQHIHDKGTRLLKGQCFETTVLAEGRDSGAPMFNSNGFLVGLLSMSYTFESGLPNSLCVSILEIADIPIHGKPICELWTTKPRAAFCRKISY